MKKNQISSEEKAINLIKKTSSDINQLYSELESELSEEFLKSDDEKEFDAIRKALDIISGQKDKFLMSTKNAILVLKKEEVEKEEELQVIHENKIAGEMEEYHVPNNVVLDTSNLLNSAESK